MLPKVRKILYSTDLSLNAVHAFRYAVYLAMKTGAEVHILHVVEILSNDAKFVLQTYVLDSGSREAMLSGRVHKAREQLEKRLEEFWKELDPADRDVSKQIASINVCESYPAEEILKKAGELECDLIVMGTHEKGLGHTFVGSVAKSVMHRSRIPTVIVPLPEALY